MPKTPLIEFTPKGLYCRAGDFYIDPWKPVDKAIITHAHSDHARFGSQHYLCHHDSLPILKLRLGDVVAQSVGYNETVTENGVKISLHPAGHIIGSSQVRVEYKNEVWVFSGDYKVENDGLSTAFEPVKCNVFITESTFGLPIYKWKPQTQIFEDIQQWVLANNSAGKASVIIAYSLGKAQRVMEAVKNLGIPIFLHGAVWKVHNTLVNAGWQLPTATRVNSEVPKENYKGSIVIAPPGAEGTPWMKRFKPHAIGICSGWMQVRGNTRRKNADAGFVLSDHADWNGLLTAVKETNAEKVFATHGFQSAFSRYLTETGIEAHEVKTEFGNDEEALPDENKEEVEE